MSAVLGSALIRFSAKSQSVIALSTSESELYALVSATATGIGLIQLAGDLGLSLKLQVRCDATSCIVAASREGLGKAKHVNVSYLWVQDIFRSGKADLVKVSTHLNRGDLGTKALPPERVAFLTKECGCEFLAGRHKLALAA